MPGDIVCKLAEARSPLLRWLSGNLRLGRAIIPLTCRLIRNYRLRFRLSTAALALAASRMRWGLASSSSCRWYFCHPVAARRVHVGNPRHARDHQRALVYAHRHQLSSAHLGPCRNPYPNRMSLRRTPSWTRPRPLAHGIYSTPLTTSGPVPRYLLLSRPTVRADLRMCGRRAGAGSAGVCSRRCWSPFVYPRQGP